MRDEPDHLVQRHAALDDGREFRERGHVGVHLGVAEPEEEGFIANQPNVHNQHHTRISCPGLGGNSRLIMTLSIRNRLLAIPPIRQRMTQRAHIPLDILLLLQPLNIQIRHRHRQPVVEPYPTQAERHTQRRHAAHVLRDRDRVRVEGVQHFVREHEVHDAVFVHVGAEVLVVAARKAGADAVMRVEHAGHAVEAEAVEVVLFHPKAQIREQEAQDLVVAVVEDPTVPELVATARAAVEVQRVAVVEHVEAVEHVLAGVRVHDVQQDGDAHAVRGVDQRFEVVGEAVARGGGEEGVDLVAEGGVVGVLHHGHELDGVVTELLDARERVVREFLVGRYFGVRAGDADVRFVDAGGGWFGRAGVAEVVFVRWVPEAGVVDGRDGEVLRHACYPCRHPLLPRLIVGHHHADLELAVVLDGGSAVDGREADLPHAVRISLHLMAVSVPAVEVSDQIGTQRIRRPFAVGDGAVVCYGEAEFLIPSRELLQPALGVVDGVDPLLRLAVSTLQCRSEVCEVGIELDHACGRLVLLSTCLHDSDVD